MRTHKQSGSRAAAADNGQVPGHEKNGRPERAPRRAARTSASVPVRRAAQAELGPLDAAAVLSASWCWSSGPSSRAAAWPTSA